MAEASSPSDVKLICGMISADVALFDRAVEALAAEFSPVDLRSEVMPFDFTHYYDAQMGSPLWRQFTAFERPVSPETLAAAKVATNRIEADFASSIARMGGMPVLRPINLDVGYIDESKLILASMKNFSHRIYLSQGVYAELTLMYHKGRWDALGWTFPDFASGRYHNFLTQARDRLRQHLVHIRNHETGDSECQA